MANKQARSVSSGSLTALPAATSDEFIRSRPVLRASPRPMSGVINPRSFSDPLSSEMPALPETPLASGIQENQETRVTDTAGTDTSDDIDSLRASQGSVDNSYESDSGTPELERTSREFPGSDLDIHNKTSPQDLLKSSVDTPPRKSSLFAPTGQLWRDQASSSSFNSPESKTKLATVDEADEGPFECEFSPLSPLPSSMFFSENELAMESPTRHAESSTAAAKRRGVMFDLSPLSPLSEFGQDSGWPQHGNNEDDDADWEDAEHDDAEYEETQPQEQEHEQEETRGPLTCDFASYRLSRLDIGDAARRDSQTLPTVQALAEDLSSDDDSESCYSQATTGTALPQMRDNDVHSEVASFHQASSNEADESEIEEVLSSPVAPSPSTPGAEKTKPRSFFPHFPKNKGKAPASESEASYTPLIKQDHIQQDLGANTPYNTRTSRVISTASASPNTYATPSSTSQTKAKAHTLRKKLSKIKIPSPSFLGSHAHQFALDAAMSSAAAKMLHESPKSHTKILTPAPQTPSSHKRASRLSGASSQSPTTKTKALPTAPERRASASASASVSVSTPVSKASSDTPLTRAREASNPVSPQTPYDLSLYPRPAPLPRPSLAHLPADIHLHANGLLKLLHQTYAAATEGLNVAEKEHFVNLVRQWGNSLYSGAALERFAWGQHQLIVASALVDAMDVGDVGWMVLGLAEVTGDWNWERRGALGVYVRGWVGWFWEMRKEGKVMGVGKGKGQMGVGKGKGKAKADEIGDREKDVFVGKVLGEERDRIVDRLEVGYVRERICVNGWPGKVDQELGKVASASFLDEGPERVKDGLAKAVEREFWRRYEGVGERPLSAACAGAS